MRLLLLCAFCCLAFGNCSEPQSSRVEAPDATDTGLHERLPGEAARHVVVAPGATAMIVEGLLGAGETAQFVLGEEEGSLLMAHILSPANDLTLSVHRMDTGEEIHDEAEGPSFWRGHLPATLGYLLEVTGSERELEYSLEVEVPRRISFDGGSSSTEISSWAPPHVPVAFVLPGAAGRELAADLSSAPVGWFFTLHGLHDGDAQLSATARAREFRAKLPSDQEYILRLHPGAAAGDFTLTISFQ